jgi:hypothetical protein
VKSRAQRRIGTAVTHTDGRTGTIVGVGSQERQPIVGVQWADGTVSWHRRNELTHTDNE